MNKINMMVALCVLVIFYSCTPKASKTITTKNTAYAKFVSKYNEQALAEGRVLMEAKCGKCHKLKDTQKYNVEKWDNILNNMIPKTKVSEEEGNKIRAYIYSVAPNT
jgi:mono/diheme cytochrome c family protein